MTPLFMARILGKYDVQYFHCRDCGFVRTERPYWLEEAYSAAIAVTDTGILQRNWTLSAKLASTLYFCFEPRAAYLDVAGGYGILTRQMRDYGFDYYWEDKYCDNLLARGFEAAAATTPFAALSGFEVIEHTVDPAEFVSEIMARHHCRTLLFSTVTYPGEQPPAPDWWYYSPMTGQHISFFHVRTLQRLAARLGLSFRSSGGLHVFTDRPLRNGWLFPLLNTPLAYVLVQLIRLRLGSRVWTDHTRLAGRAGGQ
jgi:Methyltransferase domain